MGKRGLIAFGGNALIRSFEKGTMEEQWENAYKASKSILNLEERFSNFLLVHGNGPQVGQSLLRVEEAITKVPPITLDACVAETQGSMGYMISVCLSNGFMAKGKSRKVVTILTTVEVDPEDPAFKNPTKPIGPFYSSYRAKFLMEQEKWPMIEDAGRGYRKVVPSPRPLKIMEIDMIKKLYEGGDIVIAGGGGGIPIVKDISGVYTGIEAVIDKDYTALLLAKSLNVDQLVMLTSVDRLYLHYGTDRQIPLSRLTVSELEGYYRAREFPPGSMGPKVEAIIGFLKNTKSEVLLTSPETLEDGLAGKNGTFIVSE